MTKTYGKVLVVDDVRQNADLLKRVLTREGYTVVLAASGSEALEAVAHHQPDVVLMDVMMPDMNGFEACQALKWNPATRLLPVVLLTALNDDADRIEGINVGADDFLSKPVNPQELLARVRSLVRLKRYTDDLDSAESVIMSLARTIEARDTLTEDHCNRLASYATDLAFDLGLPGEQLAALQRGAYLHDIGKIAVPDAILLKPGRLTPDEWKIMQRHPVVGDELCGTLRSLRNVRPIVRHHHERRDGSGYPDGLAGDDIPLLAQIMGIVDAFDAVTSARPYKQAWSHERGYEELRAEVAKGWRRSDLVEAFIRLGRTGRLQAPRDLLAPAGTPPLSVSVLTETNR